MKAESNDIHKCIDCQCESYSNCKDAHCCSIDNHIILDINTDVICTYFRYKRLCMYCKYARPIEHKNQILNGKEYNKVVNEPIKCVKLFRDGEPYTQAYNHDCWTPKIDKKVK